MVSAFFKSTETSRLTPCSAIVTPNSLSIWLLLEYPTTPDRIVDILQLAFPEVPTADIRSDTARFLNDLAHAGLIGAAA